MDGHACGDVRQPAARRAYPEQAVVTLIAVVLFGWHPGRNGWSNHYYAAAVRSMGTGWNAFRYASVDAGGWVTVDKPPLAFWLQSLSARLFGFSPWAVLLPSVVLSAASVWLLIATVRRVVGRAAGLLSGVLFALTPIVVAMSRSNMPDATLTFFAVLASWAAVRGGASAAWRWPVVIGAAAAAGFLTKSVAIGLALPGIGAGYLLGPAGGIRQRLVRATAAGGVFIAVVGVWLASIDTRPLSSRPWIGGSSDGSAWNLVFGYHFSVFGGEGGLAPGVGRGPGPLRGLFMVFGGERGIGRMFNDGMGDQVLWWFPMAVLGVVAATAGGERWRRRDPLVGAGVMWALWATVSMLVFSFTKGVLHPYYVVEFAPPLAALAAVGAVQTWKAGNGWWRLAGGTAVFPTGAVQLILLRRNPSYRWLRWAIPLAVASAAIVAVAVAWRVRRASWRPSPPATVGAVLLVAPLLVAPLLWSLSAVRHTVGGLFPAARPGTDSFSFGPPSFGSPYGFSDFDDDTLRWLDRQRTTESWTIAMSSAMVGQDAIIAGHRVLAVGGFSGGDRAAGAARVAGAVAEGRVRYFLAGGAPRDGPAQPDVFAAVRSACVQVPSETWGGAGTSGVYDCRGRAAGLLAPSS